MTTYVNGGILLARSLGEAGVDLAFALHGGHLDAFWAACADAGIDLVDGRHEAAVGHAAEGYARVTGKIGVAVVTSGPGFANGMAALANAMADAMPMLMISSSPPQGEALTNEMQGGLDQVAAARTVTKWAHRVTAVERVPDLVALAIRSALSGRPGPVYLELPIDVLATEVCDEWVPTAGSAILEGRTAPPPLAVDAALTMLRAAERPVLIVGGGGNWSRCGDVLAEFATRTQIPVFANSRGYGSLDASHPMNAGAIDVLRGFIASGQGQPDVIMLFGARSGLFTGGRSGSMLAGSQVIQVDIDASEIGRLGPVDLGLVGDCGQTLQAMLTADDHSDRVWPERTDWVSTTTGLGPLVNAMLGADLTTEDGRIHPYRAARDAMLAAGPGAFGIFDGGEAPLWPMLGLSVAPPARVLTLGYMGFLGTGMGFAVGAQAADRGRRVLHITGDGALGFHLQEFDTMVRHDLPVVTVVLNNSCWGMSIHGQHAVYGPGKDVITRLADTRYDLVAQGFGCYAENVADATEVQPAVERAFASGRPACINVMTSASVVHPATTQMLGNLDAQDEIVIPYYDNIRKR